MEWTKQMIFELISQFEVQECLWNVNIKEYKNQTKKKDAWKIIAKNISVDVETVDKKMKSILAAYRREKKKEADSVTSGSSADDIYTSKWFAYPKLSFLSGMNKPRKTLPNQESSQTEIEYVNVDDEEFRTNVDHSTDKLSNAGTSNASMDHNSESDVKIKNENSFEEVVNASKNYNSESNTRKRKNENKVYDILQSLVQHTKPQTSSDEYSAFGEVVAHKIRKLQTNSERATVQHHINNILYNAEMGNYRHAETFRPLAVSVPIASPTYSSTTEHSSSI